jgi:hypothetical protein
MKLLKLLASLVAAAVILAALSAAILAVRGRMDRIRTEQQLISAAAVENAPPVVAFTTVALGSFRGLVADMLWLRARRMQDEGNYFEMVQLASWIVKLQPKFTGATAYLAWNMAYNISVTFNGFDDRWRWVQRGIELIRDEALLYNPDDPELFKELGWIYQHKLGQEMDDANRYYKVQLARQMLEVLGEYPADWAALAATPRDEEGLRWEWGEDSALWRILAESNLELKQLEALFREQNALPGEIAEALAKEGLAAGVTNYLRARWLRQRHKLDPARLSALDQRYGALDWRLPEAHAIYWASRGLEVAEDGKNIACERMIFQSLSNAFRGGRMIWLEDAGTLEITPNINLVDAVNEKYVDAMAKFENNTSIKAGYENFVIDAVVTLYSFGREEKAGEYYGILREMFDRRKYRRSVDEFALQELAGDISEATYDQGQAAVQGFLFQMCYSLALGDYDRAEAFERIARNVWRKYMSQIGESTHKRRGLAPYPEMKQRMYQRCLEQFPPALRARLRQTAGRAKLPAPTENER